MSALGMKVKERLLQFIKYKKISNMAFEKTCGLSNGYIRNFKGNLGEEKLANILTAFPELNKSWLLYGDGPMLVGQQDQPKVATKELPKPENSLVEYLQRKIAELEKEKNDLLQENAVLRYENKLLTTSEG